MSKLVPINDRVVLKRVDADVKTPGGLYIPGNAQDKPTEAIVVAVGPGRILDNGTLVVPQVKEGDRVLFGKYSGQEVTLGGEDLLVMREEDLIGKLT